MTAAGSVRAALRSEPLSNRNFRLLATGQFTSTVGDYCYAVALRWLVLSTHGGPVLLGTVLACYGVPRTVFIPLGGWLADKVGSRAIMLAADTARCGLVAALTVLAARHVASLALLGPLAALLGAGEGLFIPASFAIMPSGSPRNIFQPARRSIPPRSKRAASRARSWVVCWPRQQGPPRPSPSMQPRSRSRRRACWP